MAGYRTYLTQYRTRLTVDEGCAVAYKSGPFLPRDKRPTWRESIESS